MPACDERWNERLSAWHDGEVSRSERGAVEHHVRTCALCARAAEEFRVVQRGMRILAGRTAPARRGAHRALRRALAIAAAVLVVSGIALAAARSFGRNDLGATLAAELEGHHLRSFSRTPTCEFQSSDPAAVGAWVERSLGYRVDVPVIRGATLLGARRCMLSGASAAHLLYRVGERALTVYVPAPSSEAHGAAARFASGGARCEKGPLGEDMCVVPGGKQLQVAVSEIPAPQLVALVSARTP